MLCQTVMLRKQFHCNNFWESKFWEGLMFLESISQMARPRCPDTNKHKRTTVIVNCWSDRLFAEDHLFLKFSTSYPLNSGQCRDITACPDQSALSFALFVKFCEQNIQFICRGTKGIFRPFKAMLYPSFDVWIIASFCAISPGRQTNCPAFPAFPGYGSGFQETNLFS